MTLSEMQQAALLDLYQRMQAAQREAQAYQRGIQGVVTALKGPGWQWDPASGELQPTGELGEIARRLNQTQHEEE